MKKISALALVALMSVSSVYAGGLAPTITTVDVTVDKAPSSVSPLLILGLLILIGVLVSRNNDDNND